MSHTTNSPDPTEEKQSNWAFYLGLIALAALAAAFILGGGLNESGASPETAARPSGETVTLPGSGGPLAVGTLPYDFTLPDLDGNSIQLNDLIGRPIVINFWATWCAPCRAEMPELQAAFNAYQDQGLVMLAVNHDESAAAVQLFFRDEFGLTFTPLLDDGKTVANLYGVGRTLPTTFFIDPSGEITVLHRGPMTGGQIEDYLAQTLP